MEETICERDEFFISKEIYSILAICDFLLTVNTVAVLLTVCEIFLLLVFMLWQAV